MNLPQKHQDKQEYPKPAFQDAVERKDNNLAVSFGNTPKIWTARKGCLFSLEYVIL